MQRRRILDEISKEDMELLLIECDGNISKVARKCGFHYSAVYRYLEHYPELAEVRKKADEQKEHIEAQTAYSVIDDLLDESNDPTVRFKMAQMILRENKTSRYYREEKEAEASSGMLYDIARISQELSESQSEVKRLREQMAPYGSDQ